MIKKLSYEVTCKYATYENLFAHKSGKESISLTLAILCATVCFSDNIDTITLIFCEGNPDANLLTKN